jgi:hypothetical protein
MPPSNLAFFNFGLWRFESDPVSPGENGGRVGAGSIMSSMSVQCGLTSRPSSGDCRSDRDHGIYSTLAISAPMMTLIGPSPLSS